MKRSLVIGCAAVALAAGCGTASAQSKFDVVVGGDAFFQAAYVDQDIDNGLRKTEFANRFRLNVTPTAKADNGLEYGARLRVRAIGNGNNRSTDSDRAYIFASGGFGTVQAGLINGLSDEYGVISPNVDGISGSPDGFYGNFFSGDAPLVLGALRTLESGVADTKVVYLSPKFSGFQVGAAYTSAYGDANTSVNRFKNTATSPFYRDLGEVQATYTGAFGAVTVDASVAYQFGKANRPGFEDLSSVHAGLNVGYGAFKVGGSYAFSGDSGYAKGTRGIDDQQVWILGAQYTAGPVILAATYTDAQGISFGGSDSRAHLWQAGVTYTIAPGLTTGLEYSYLDNKVANVNNDANIILLDTRFAF